jgi:hypothetical protein
VFHVEPSGDAPAERPEGKGDSAGWECGALFRMGDILSGTPTRQVFHVEHSSRATGEQMTGECQLQMRGGIGPNEMSSRRAYLLSADMGQASWDKPVRSKSLSLPRPASTSASHRWREVKVQHGRPPPLLAFGLANQPFLKISIPRLFCPT